ncbi:hypothetical protein [Aquabacterium sp.]|uniref:hypothetical protein n=1 Tax=Aquabacterium sp. TaxID=1872578 RepID=UPI004037EB88
MKPGDVVTPRRRELRIDAFPSGKDLWRIDWFGPIAFPDRAVRRRQPSVLVSLSKADPAVREDPEWLLDAGMSGTQTKRWVSVGTLMLLRIGDVWSDKTRVMEPAYESVIFEDVEVSRHTATLVKAGAPLPDGNGYLLPMSEHPWHRDNTQSYCVKVSLDEDNCDLVIPCMELIRHYFGSSSDLLSRLFTPPLTQERLFEHWHLDRPGGRMSLGLAEGVPGTSAEDVARVAASKSAWAAACLVGESCLRASLAGREIYPQARFPFEGRTQLAVKGKWLPQRGESRRRTFVVYQITSCWHPFPFGSLKYRTKGLTRRFMPPTAQPERPAYGPRAKTPKQPTLCEEDAGSGLTPASIKIESQSRFPDLDEKCIWMSRPLIASSSDRPQMATSKAEPVEQLAVGEPWSDRRVRSVSLEVATRNFERQPPAYVEALLDAFDALPQKFVTLLTASAFDGWTIPVVLLADEDGVIDDALLTSVEGRTVPRRACVFLIQTETSSSLMVAIEAPVLMPLWYPSSQDGSADPLRILNVAPDDFARRVSKPSKTDAVFNCNLNADRERLVRWVTARCK